MNPTKRLIAALLAVAALGLVLMLPNVSAIKPSAVIMNLPAIVGNWHGQSIAESQKVRDTLARDTGFEKAVYSRRSTSDPSKLEYIHATIVLGGQDPNNSIHRPERCLPAQGNRLISSSEITIPVFGTEPLKVTRLKTVGIENGVSNLTYYWFVGNSRVTNSHYERTLADMQDRIFGGFNQRWAYVTVAAPFDHSDDQVKMGDEAEVSAAVEEFIENLFPKIHELEKLPLPEI